MTPTDEPEPAGPGQARIPPYLRAEAWQAQRARGPQAQRAGAPEAQPAGAPEALPERGPPPEDAGAPGGSRLRPFILTSGRVEVDPDIRLETQVTAAGPAPWATPVNSLAPELQAIVSLCAEPISVAEISARMPLHLGVARVLVSDLRRTGHLDVHTADVVNPHDPETILRVIRGLRAIS